MLLLPRLFSSSFSSPRSRPRAARALFPVLLSVGMVGISLAAITLAGCGGSSKPTPPPADFSLTGPADASAVAGGTPFVITFAASQTQVLKSPIVATFSGFPAGVSGSPNPVTITPGQTSSITITASKSAVPGEYTITLTAVSDSVSHVVTFVLTITGATVGTDVITYHNDIARTGQNLTETTLTTGNVNSATFGKLAFMSMTGAVDAEPLYLSSVTIGTATHNVLYAVTEHDNVYAFDADSGAQLWMASMLKSGEKTSGDHGCGQITPEIGITSTPVIDRYHGPRGTIYLVATSVDSNNVSHQRLHALDLTTGADESGSPAEITATYPGTGDNSSKGIITFDPSQYAERTGLLLTNGALYLAWTSHCDDRPYTGWVMAYDQASLAQTSVIDVTPNGSEGAMWMAGDGLAADSTGNIYFLDANGTFDATLDHNNFPINQDYGNAFVKLFTSDHLAIADYFEMYNGPGNGGESAGDTDLGSGGAILLPDVKDSNGTAHQLAVGAGKDSNIYVVDRNNLGKFNPSNNNAAYQVVSGALGSGVFATPAYWNNIVYYGPVGQPIKGLPIVNAKLDSTNVTATSHSFGYPGTTPSISSNGTSNGIVWAMDRSGILYAFDATKLSSELYDSNQASGSRDHFGSPGHFPTPMIANGKVYLQTTTGVAVFGILP